MIPDKLLPEKYRDQAFIAGGFAACPSLALDMDVWVMAPCPFVKEAQAGDLRTMVHLHQVREELLAHLYTTYPRWAIAADVVTRITDEDMGRYMADGKHVTLKVADVKSHTPQIQLLVTDAEYPGVVLEGFDISTHQVALTRGGLIRGSGWTPITMAPILIRDNGNSKERLIKITERYRYHAD